MEKLRVSPPEPQSREQLPSLDMLHLCSIGLVVIGLRAYVNPEKYGDSEFIRNAVDTARYLGYVGEDGIRAPAELMDFAFGSQVEVQ